LGISESKNIWNDIILWIYKYLYKYRSNESTDSSEKTGYTPYVQMEAEEVYCQVDETAYMFACIVIKSHNYRWKSSKLKRKSHLINPKKHLYSAADHRQCPINKFCQFIFQIKLYAWMYWKLTTLITYIKLFNIKFI
jgi:hypothetical protein